MQGYLTVVLVYMHFPQWNMQRCPTVVLVYMHSPQWNMQGCPTVILVYMHSPPKREKTDHRDAMGTPEY
jgi:hypothetical protein